MLIILNLQEHLLPCLFGFALLATEYEFTPMLVS